MFDAAANDGLFVCLSAGYTKPVLICRVHKTSIVLVATLKEAPSWSLEEPCWGHETQKILPPLEGKP